MSSNIRCWLCQETSENEKVTLRSGNTRDIFYCKVCHFRFLNSDNHQLLSTNKLDETRLRGAGLEIPEVSEDFAKGMAQSQPYVSQFIDAHDKGQNVLEIGCSWGYFLSVASQKGINPFGVEINPVRTQYVKEQLGIPCFRTLEELRAAHSGSFAKIFSFYVLEYVPEPIKHLSTLYDMLEPGGKIVMITPNLDDVLKDIWQNSGFRNFFFEECSIGYYSVKSVEQLLKPLGTMGAKVSIKTQQGYSFVNHLSWHLTQKPRTTGIVGGDRYIEDIWHALESSNSELGMKLGGLLKKFDGEYRKTIESFKFGNRILFEVLKPTEQKYN